MVALLEGALDKIAEGLDKDKLVRQVVAKALRDYRSLPQITLHIARSQERALHKDIERLTQEARLAGMVQDLRQRALGEGSVPFGIAAGNGRTRTRLSSGSFERGTGRAT